VSTSPGRLCTTVLFSSSSMLFRFFPFLRLSLSCTTRAHQGLPLLLPRSLPLPPQSTLIFCCPSGSLRILEITSRMSINIIANLCNDASHVRVSIMPCFTVLCPSERYSSLFPQSRSSLLLREFRELGIRQWCSSLRATYFYCEKQEQDITTCSTWV
jgi:hypothetical protein